ncbi:MAG: hypothetical protein R2832_05865 [Rhodothermales bacterium]
MTFGHNPLLLVGAILIALLASVWVYRRTVPDVGRVRVLLGLLRFAVLGLILFLLFRPTLRSTSSITRPATLAILVDASSSLSVTSAGPSGGLPDSVRHAIQRLIPAVPGASQLYTFGSTVNLTGSGSLDSLAADQQRTNISSALESVRDQQAEDNLRAVLLVSDGRHNTGRNPLFVADRYPVPIYSVILGDTTVKRDVAITSVATNDIAYVDSEVPVRVEIRAEGYDDSRLTVSLSSGGRVLDQQNVQLSVDRPSAGVDLAFTPASAGLQQLRVSVTQLDGESTNRNNSELIAIRVLDSRKRVLVLGSAPDPDVSAIVQILRTDPNLDVREVVQKSRRDFYGSVSPDSVDTFDLIVLAGYPGRVADPGLVASVAAAAESGTPLLFMVLRSTDLSEVAARLRTVLPAVPELVRPDYFEVSVAPDPAAANHSIFEGVDTATAGWLRLSPLTQSNSRWTMAPDATRLAHSLVRGVDIDSPTIVALQRTGYRSLAVLASGLWKWNNGPEDVAEFESVWRQTLLNAVQWLTADRDDRPVRVSPASDAFAESDRIKFNGQVYDDTNQPVSGAALLVEVVGPDGSRIPYNLEDVGNGRYAVDAPPLPAGAYSFRATATRNGASLGSDNGSFSVGELSLEFRDTKADPVLMRQLAERSGGRTLAVSSLDRLPAMLASSDSFLPQSETIVEDSELWRRRAFLVLALMLLTAEWFVRKRGGLV